MDEEEVQESWEDTDEYLNVGTAVRSKVVSRSKAGRVSATSSAMEYLGEDAPGVGEGDVETGTISIRN